MMRETSSQLTYDPGLLEGHRARWEQSAALRWVYGRIFRAVERRRVAGPSLEVGSGIGVSKDFLPGIVTSDIVATPYADRVVSAYAIPDAEGGGGWANIIAVDVLHHLVRPFEFFRSAAERLRPGGRIVLVEPAATPWGRLFYSSFHHEPIRLAPLRPPFVFEPDTADGSFANMAMATALFERYGPEVDRRLGALGLRRLEIRYRDCLAYPMSGGFSRRSPVPPCLIRAVGGVEDRLPGWFFRLAGLRAVVVLERAEGQG